MPGKCEHLIDGKGSNLAGLFGWSGVGVQLR